MGILWIYSIFSLHVETVVLLRRENVDGYIDIDLDVKKLTGKGGTASYEEIKEYVKERYGLKVSSLYIAQMKGKAGIKERENYNHGSGEGKVLHCPPEKEAAIMGVQKIGLNQTADLPGDLPEFFRELNNLAGTRLDKMFSRRLELLQTIMESRR